MLILQWSKIRHAINYWFLTPFLVLLFCVFSNLSKSKSIFKNNCQHVRILFKAHFAIYVNLTGNFMHKNEDTLIICYVSMYQSPLSDVPKALF